LCIQVGFLYAQQSSPDFHYTDLLRKQTTMENSPNPRVAASTGRIESTFARLKEQNRAALVAYITAGDPDLPRSFAIARAVADAGADILELGVPFSDPLADGPTIQAAANRAIEAGATLPKLLNHLRDFRASCDVPVVLFTYLNPVYVYGFEKFHSDAAAAGADGILILDLPPDEAQRNAELSRSLGLRAIRLIAPTTPAARVAQICSSAEGFIYYVSREGVTGEQQELSASIPERVALIRQHTELPVCVGFGISTPEQAAAIAGQSDGAVVGSAIVRRIAEFGNDPDLPGKIAEFVQPLAEAVHGA